MPELKPTCPRKT